MKRSLAMALGAIMVAGSAAPAAAASHIDFSGFYRAYYEIQSNPKYASDPQAYTDSFFADRFNLDVTFAPTDEIAVYWRIRSPHFERWGDDDRGGSTLTSRHIYGEIKQDWGTVYVGRLHEDFDSWGLANLGWIASLGYWSALDAFGDASPLDGIRYVNRWDNGLQLMAQYSRLDEDYINHIESENWWEQTSPYEDLSKDADSSRDRFQVELAYFWDGGGASLGGIYERDSTGTPKLGGVEAWTSLIPTNTWYINPAIMHSWGDFSVHFEGKAGWASQDIQLPWPWSDFEEGDGYAAYLDLNYNYGPGSVTLAGWWASGADYNDWNAAIVGMGGNFYPLVAAYGSNAGINGGRDASGRDISAGRGIDNVVARANAIGADVRAANFGNTSSSDLRNDPLGNHWGVTLGGQHSFTDSVTMAYAVGYLALNEETWRTTAANGTFTQDKEIGFEVDLGFNIQLLDNLNFNTTFGYLFAGDALITPTLDQAGNLALPDAEDTYVWVNTLQFNF